MKYTTRLNLNKPELNENVMISVLNENMDILDAAVGDIKEGTAEIPELETEDKKLAGAINEINNGLTTHLAEDASLTKKGHVLLNDDTNSTSITQAATANVVKRVYDLANGKYSKPESGIPRVDLAQDALSPNRETGSWNDTATKIPSGGTYTKTIPLGFAAKKGFIAMESNINGYVTLIRFGADPIKSISYGYSSQSRHIRGRTDFTELAPPNGPAGADLSIKDCYIQNNNLIISFGNNLSSIRTLGILRLYWEVEE